MSRKANCKKVLLYIMIGLIISVVLFNLVAFKTNTRLTKNQIIHIWTFTIVFQLLVDLFIDDKYHGYWYFNEATEFKDLPTITVLIPPVNMIFLNWYPFNQTFFKKCLYVFIWTVAITLYEVLTLLPEPWGYFHHGWWKTWYSAVVNPFLLMSVILYYKWVHKHEKQMN